MTRSADATPECMHPETIPGLLRWAAKRFVDLEAIVDGDVTLTYRALAAEVAQATRALMARGIAAGDRVALWAPNCWEWIVAALAVHGAGGVLVPINTRFKGSEAAYLLQKSRARVLLTVNGFLGNDYPALLRVAGIDLPHLEAIILLRGTPAEGTSSWAELLETAEAVSEDAAETRARGIDPDDLCDILFTSGTTGHPKGVMCTHAQSLRTFRVWGETVGLRAGDRYLVVAPFFHTFGYKAGWLASLMAGATVLPQAVFDAGAVLERLGRDRVTVLPGPPALYQSILARPDLERYDLSSLRLAVTGAAVIHVELIHRMRRELRFDTVLTAYGLTETTGVVTMCRTDDTPETIAHTSGRAIPGVELRVIDAEGADVPRDQPGEVLVRGYNVMTGYFEDPAETAAVIDAEGWLHTGDIGVLDARGNLRITDRKKDMFIVGGFNAYPAEIENKLLRFEQVAQVGVVGVPDARLGEVGMAFIVLRPGAHLSAERVIAYCRDEMANYKVPRWVEFVDQLPMNASGKVLKYQLRERGRALIEQRSEVASAPPREEGAPDEDIPRRI